MDGDRLLLAIGLVRRSMAGMDMGLGPLESFAATWDVMMAAMLLPYVLSFLGCRAVLFHYTADSRSGSRAGREACGRACHPALARVPRTPVRLPCRPPRDQPTGATCSRILDAADWPRPDGDSPPPRRHACAATRRAGSG